MTRLLIQRACARALGATAVLLLAGCSALPVYQPAPGDATVNFVGMGRPSFCTGSGSFKLDVVEADGYRSAKVPAGVRVSLWSAMSFHGYNVVSNCSPGLAFTPQAGQAYIVNAGLNHGKCFMELVREDKSRETGLALEPSLAAPGC